MLVLGQAGADPAAAAAADVQVQSVFDFIQKGGVMMVPIIGASLIALAVFVERLLCLRRSIVIPPGFQAGVTGALRDSCGKAVDYCKSDGSPVAAIFLAGIRKLGQDQALVEKSIQDAGEREVVKLRKYLRLLSVIAAVAPLMGLLGTILGMINAFQTVATSGDALGKTELLATGIYEAMITTAAGLLLAIPALMAYHFISARIDSLVLIMDQMSVDFVEEFAAPGASAGVISERTVVSDNGRKLIMPPAPAAKRSKSATPADAPAETVDAGDSGQAVAVTADEEDAMEDRAVSAGA
ncbi:MAG: MotA/TolQ/ExbB proton channel family protein [Phycisphaerales bacterium]|nr:MAG: MotA/TolQ/ExbB proton channel family protein [Phycisphaerales bacterium]